MAEKPRLVSLVPCITDTLHSLGLADQIVGVTRYCPRTPNARILGGIHDVNLEKLAALKPDCVLADTEENGVRGVDALRVRFPVTQISVRTVADAVRSISTIAEAAEVPERGWEMVATSPPAPALLEPKGTVAALIWKGPWRAVGLGTYAEQLLDHVGLTNVVDRPGYPDVTLETLRSQEPDLLLLPTEPYEFTELEERKIQDVMGPNIPTLRVDGRLLFWYGARTLTALDTWTRLVEQNLGG